MGHDVCLVHDKRSLIAGDILFLVSCSQIVTVSDRAKFKAVLVLHASDLPNGRGWSPHIWAVTRGATRITVCLLEAQDPVDTGAVWLRDYFELEGHELLPEINDKLFQIELRLMSLAVERFDSIEPVPQTGDPGVYLRKRTPEDSKIDPERSVAEQFDVLRVVDNQRYPAFFDFRGKRFKIEITKIDDEPKSRV